jgi:hypothetical protein
MAAGQPGNPRVARRTVDIGVGVMRAEVPDQTVFPAATTNNEQYLAWHDILFVN